MKNIDIKIKNLFKLIFGLIPSIIIFYYKKINFKKIVLVSLFSSKFGHFYQNTEYFLRKKYNKKKFFIFYPEFLIDNIFLLEEWKKKIFIVPNFIGYTLFKLRNLLNIEFYNCREFPSLERKYYLRKGFLTQKIKATHNNFTCSIRVSNYQKKNQVVSSSYQEYRDTNLDNFNWVISKFLKKTRGFKGVLLNSDAKKLVKESINSKNFRYNNSKSFKNLLDEISKSNFHFGAYTGVDAVVFAHNIPTGLFNVMLGSSFNFSNYPSKCIVSPSLLFDSKEKKILSLKKNIELLKYMEKKYKKDRFDLEDQIKFKLEYKKSTKDEMYNLLSEIYLFSIGLFKLNKKQKNLQKKFWSIYPKVQKEVLTRKIVSDQREYKPYISPYFLEKYERILF